LRPATEVNQASTFWEWKGPAPTPPPTGTRRTTGTRWPQRQWVLARLLTRLTDSQNPRLGDRAMRPTTDQSDETLAFRAQQGDQEAVSVLVRRHSGRLYGFLQRYHPDRDDCEDLLQETWIRALANLKRFDPKKRFSTWLFQIALNLSRDLARRDQVRSGFRRRTQEMKHGMGGGTTEEKVDAMKAMQAIETLPQPQKEVLLLRYYHGFPEAEVSEILGCPRGTVKSRLHQAVKAVRVMLEPREGDP